MHNFVAWVVKLIFHAPLNVVPAMTETVKDPLKEVEKLANTVREQRKIAASALDQVTTIDEMLKDDAIKTNTILMKQLEELKSRTINLVSALTANTAVSAAANSSVIKLIDKLIKK